MPPPHFLYFDLGNVLVTFDPAVMCRQMGEAAGIEPSRVMKAVFGQGLLTRYETGQIATEGFYQEFCRATGTRPDRGALAFAASDIFRLRASIIPVVAQLQQAGHRLGILSNTCEIHWDYCRKRFRLLNDLFAVHALSFRIGAVKPDAAIFRAAAALAGIEPGEIFFTDDCPGHVAGARATGLDAVEFTSTPQLVAELRARGLRFNY